MVVSLARRTVDLWRLEAYDYALPEGRIADRPAVPRESARLLHVGRAMADHTVGELPRLLRAGDLLVVNDTRVLPVRLEGRRGIARVAVLLHMRTTDGCWRAFARPAKRLKPGDTIVFAPEFTARVEAREEGEVTLRFELAEDEFARTLARHGAAPLPPYIARPPDARDRVDYQTMFARTDGAVAAPTAGLHFTPDMIAELERRGISRTTVTLHVGAGTFLPVKTEDLRAHRIHREWAQVPAETVAAIAATRKARGRVVAIGTTVLRALETAALSGVLAPFVGETDVFIGPDFRFRVADVLMTNFHLPRSTLLVLVSAFAGYERVRAAYDHAVADGYRFFSYGDACLLERAP
ncbi:MAG: tRNA preQ1(34) S-adenosylmethionine ribosyltransferase-isomerase QueA [Alphaproteobacteria bacterium]